MMGERVEAPFTDEQVDALNRWQRDLGVHPFTCRSGNHASHVALTATANGWCCPHCDYTQNWAHDFMIDTPQGWFDAWPSQPPDPSPASVPGVVCKEEGT